MIVEKELLATFDGINCSIQHDVAYIQHITYHPDVTFEPLHSAFTKSFQPSIFRVKYVQEDLMQINSLWVSMAGPGIFQPSIDDLLNH